MARNDVPADVALIRARISAFLRQKVDNQSIGSAVGIYAFYDYDAEPIYVGQSEEGLSARIGRHLTNQRTDAVAMNVLDPFEVASITIWPFFDLAPRKGTESAEARKNRKRMLDAAEFTVFQSLLRKSKFHAVLNEKEMIPSKEIKLPPHYRGEIIPEELYEHRKHPDIRIARRASTIANLARVISERAVSKGLRRTLLTQAKRLQWLADQRLSQVADDSDSPDADTAD